MLEHVPKKVCIRNVVLKEVGKRREEESGGGRERKREGEEERADERVGREEK